MPSVLRSEFHSTDSLVSGVACSAVSPVRLLMRLWLRSKLQQCPRQKSDVCQTPCQTAESKCVQAKVSLLFGFVKSKRFKFYL